MKKIKIKKGYTKTKDKHIENVNKKIEQFDDFDYCSFIMYIK